MIEHTDASLHDIVTRTFTTLEAKDLEKMMSFFTDDAILIDPHFPSPRIQGKATIRDGRNAVLWLYRCQLLRVHGWTTCGSRDGNPPRC